MKIMVQSCGMVDTKAWVGSSKEMSGGCGSELHHCTDGLEDLVGVNDEEARVIKGMKF